MILPLSPVRDFLDVDKLTGKNRPEFEVPTYSLRVVGTSFHQAAQQWFAGKRQKLKIISLALSLQDKLS